MVETMERQVLGRISASNGCTTIRPPWRCYGLLDDNLKLITQEKCSEERGAAESRAWTECDPATRGNPEDKHPPEAGQESVAA
jgi:hypothetical protein